MALSQHMLPTDQRLVHREAGLAAVTAGAIGAVVDQGVAMETKYTTRLLPTAISGGPQTVVVQLSNDNFTTVNESIPLFSFGTTAQRIGGGQDALAGYDAACQWSTAVNGKSYRYFRLFLVSASGSLTLGAYSSVRRG